MNHYFTADTHLGHANIMKYCGRTIFMTAKDLAIYNKVVNLSREEQKKFILSPESLHIMNMSIIRRWNERVKPGDIVYVIGDFCFKNSSGIRGEGIRMSADEWEKKLNGKIIFIKGNHDKNNSTKTIIERMVIGFGGKRINLVHNPEKADPNYQINFTGHIHKLWEIKRMRWDWRFVDCINVGVDVWNYYPVTFNEIMSRYAQWKKGLEVKK